MTHGALQSAFAAMGGSRLRTVVVAALQVLVSGGLVWLLVRSFRLDSLAGRLSDLHPAWVVWALAVLVAQLLLATERWRRIGRLHGGADHPLAFLGLLQGIGQMSSQVLPSSFGGDAIRVMGLLKREHLGLVMRVVIVDRIVGLLGLAALVLAGACIAPRLFLDNPATWTAVAFAVCGGILTLGLCLADRVALKRSAVARHVCNLGRNLRLTLRREGATRGVATSILIHLLSVLSLYLLAHALGEKVADTPSFFAVIPAALLITVAPVSIGGWGLREAAMTVAFGLVGLSSETAVLVSVLYGLLLAAAATIVAVGGLIALGAAAVQSPVSAGDDS